MLTVACIALSGGQGKSTCAYFLGKELSRHCPTLLVDADPQASLTSFLRHDVKATAPTLLEVIQGKLEVEQAIYLIKPPNLFLIPSDDGLESSQHYLASTGLAAKVLRKQLEPIRDDFTFALIDSPPQKSQICQSVIGAADYLIISAETTDKGVCSLARTLQAIEEMRRWEGTSAELLGVLPFRDRWCGRWRAKNSQAAIDCMSQLVGDKILPTFRESEQVKKAISQDLTLEGNLVGPFEHIASSLIAKLPENQVKRTLAIAS